MRLINAAGALLTLVALAIAPPWVLVRFVGNPWPGAGVSLSAPLTDSAIIGLLAVVVWLLWAQLMMCFFAEVVAATTDDRIRWRVPLAPMAFEGLARRLVTALVVVSVGVPVVVALAAPAHGETSEAAERTATPLSLVPSRSPSNGESHEGSEAATIDGQSMSTVTVMRLDDLWSIAERHLGDGERWQEIYDLNRGETMNDGSTFDDPAKIRPGWELRVPGHRHDKHSPVGSVGEKTVIVQRGDTLSEIAEAELGEADAYPQLFEASKSVVQPHGARLIDPDLIRPGWTIEVPRRAPEDPADPIRQGPEPEPPPTSRLRSEPQTPTSPAPRATAGRADREVADTSRHEDGFSALRAVLSSAVCLSAGALALLLVNRRRQFRHRRPGRTVARTPQPMVKVEQVVTDVGREAASSVEFLDHALRSLASRCYEAKMPIPELGVASLSKAEVTLRFVKAPAMEVPDEWKASEDGMTWTASREAHLDRAALGRPAPYPALASVGTDEEGRTWLLDLEAVGDVGINGPAEGVEGTVRFLAAELAVNAWSDGSRVMLADGLGAELLDLNPGRLESSEREDALRHAATVAVESDLAESNTGQDLLARRRDAALLDSAAPLVVVLGSSGERNEPVAGSDVAHLLGGAQRTRVVLIHPSSSDYAIELTGSGRLRLPRWGLELNALTLQTDEARAMAALMASTRSVVDEPAPDLNSGPLAGVAKANGAIQEAHTEPRLAADSNMSSLLPEPNDVYLKTASTTADDLDEVAPGVSSMSKKEGAAVDEQLDIDVADWFDPSSRRPKVHLLGPVKVTALAGVRQGLPSVPVTIEMIVCLACHESDMTSDQLADAMGWSTMRTVQNRAADVRKFLGRRADGAEWLPDANTTSSAKRGVPSYELDRGPGGVLVDGELLVRLRARAQRRGIEGIDDLVTALRLVEGRPFDRLRMRGYLWLLDGHRYDHMLVATVEDIAHLLATRANSEGRTDLVRQACEAARKANPDGPIAWLDQAAADETDYGKDAAEKLVREHVIDVDDEDPPERVEQILRQRRWLAG